MPPLKNIKHEMFAKSFVAHKANATEAYAAVYPNTSEPAARSSSSELLTKPNVKNRCIELLEKQAGSRLDTLLNDLIDKKDAERIIIINDTLHKVADNPVQLEAIKTLLKLHGVLSTNNVEQVNNDNRAIIFNIEAGNIEKVAALIDNMKALQNNNPIAGNIQDGDIIDVPVSD